MKMKALDVANYLIAKSDNVGDTITNKKLQKLLYYVKAWGLVYFEDGVIEEPFEAWVHGPVCPTVYHAFRGFGYNPLRIEYNGMSSGDYISRFVSEHHEDEEKIGLVDAVFKKYGVLTSFQLEMLSHRSQPWIEARGDLGPLEKGSNVINDQSMKDFFSSTIKKDG